jgi:Rhodopirellula transposase DDE domain
VGLFLPPVGEVFVDGVTSKVTSDGLVDRLAPWWEAVRERFAPITTLVIKVDHGPENHRRRTPCMPRRVECGPPYRVTIRLASSPPYHRTYNPSERCGGLWEKHWHGPVLDAMETVLQCARTRTWNGKHPMVALVTTTDQTGVTWTQEAMEVVAAQLERWPVLGKWLVDIMPPALAIRDT